MKVKVSDITEDALKEVKANQIKKAQEYIKKHPNCGVLDLCFKPLYPILTMKFISNHVICTNCGHIEEKASYAIAQRAMGHKVIFTCDCGNKINC